MDILVQFLSRLITAELTAAAVVVGIMAMVLSIVWRQLDRQVDATDDVDRLRHDRLQLTWDVAVWRRRAYDAGYDGPADTGWADVRPDDAAD